MSNYLQRLLDRTTTTTPVPISVGVQPTGPSHSPISLSDQRLNDPDFVDRYGLPSDGLARFSESDPGQQRPTRHVQPRTHTDNRSFESSNAQSRLGPASPKLDSAPALKPVTQQRRETDPQEPVTNSNKAEAPILVRPIGFVDETDLVLPEPESTSDNNVVPSPPRPHEPGLKPDTNDLAEEQSPPQQSSTPNRVPIELNERELPMHPAVKPVSVSPEAELQVTEIPPSVTTASEVRPAVEALPPPIEVPAVPIPNPPISAPRPLEPVSKPPPQSLQQPQVQPEAEKPKRTRPMTAADASIIGPFTPRRRALTLFGLRRR